MQRVHDLKRYVQVNFVLCTSHSEVWIVMKKVTKYFFTVMAVAGAECNTVIELKLEHHAA